jgi:hypothetical protein
MEMTMTQNEIIEAIKAERTRQDELHPVVAKRMLPIDMSIKYMQMASNKLKELTDKEEKDGTISWHNVFVEELYEIFSETDPAKIKEEAIQLAALCVRLCETL